MFLESTLYLVDRPTQLIYIWLSFVVCQHVVYVNIPIQRQSRAICFLTSQHLQLTVCMTWLIWVKVFEKEYKVSLFCAHFWHMGTRATPSGVSINRPIHPLLTSSVDALFGRSAHLPAVFWPISAVFSSLCQQFLIPLSAVFGSSVNNGRHLSLSEEVWVEPFRVRSIQAGRNFSLELKSLLRMLWLGKDSKCGEKIVSSVFHKYHFKM